MQTTILAKKTALSATRKPVLLSGIVYSGDNGELICAKCAGQSELYTGRDLSGHKVHANTPEDASEWFAMTGRAMACERGCTVYGTAKEVACAS